MVCRIWPPSVLELLGASGFPFTNQLSAGAKIDKKDLFELAEEVILFPQEVGLLPLDQQAKMLSILANRTIR